MCSAVQWVVHRVLTLAVSHTPCVVSRATCRYLQQDKERRKLVLVGNCVQHVVGVLRRLQRTPLDRAADAVRLTAEAAILDEGERRFFAEVRVVSAHVYYAQPL